MRINATGPEEETSWDGQFKSSALEQEYRRRQLADEFSVARIVLLVNAIGVALFVSSDYRLFGTEAPFPVLVAVRIALLVLTAFVWTRLRLATRDHTPRQFDAALLLLCAASALAQVYVGSTRPATYTGHFLVHLITVLLVYCAVPLPLRLQAIPAILMSAGIALSMWLNPPMESLTTPAIAWTLIAANVLGTCVSRQLQLSARQRFCAYRKELKTRRGLEAALAELKTLRGIIPICAHCKNVRDDAGSWERIEQYVSRHSEAEFSHGICPNCIEEHFPDAFE